MEKIKLVIAMLIVGSLGIFIHYIPLPSAVIAGARAVIGTVFLFGVIVMQRTQFNWSAVRKNAIYLVISGAAIGFNWIFLFEAYKYTSVSVATLCYYMAPAFVILAAPIILKEKLTRLNVMCTIAALIGAILISGVFGNSVTSLIGICYGLAAAILYAGIMILNKLCQGLTGLELTFFQLLVSAIVMVPYVLLTEDLARIVFSGQTILLLLVVGIVHTGMVYQLFFSALNRLPAQTSSLMSYIDPVTAIILSAILLNQPLNPIQGIGTLLILGSAILNELVTFQYKKSHLTGHETIL